MTSQSRCDGPSYGMKVILQTGNMIKSKTLVKDLQRVFTLPSKKLLHAHIARVSVLYEDLRIEADGMVEESLPALDSNGAPYRKNYFLRRSIATLFEFAQEIRLLDELADFEEVKSRFDEGSLMRWNKAVRFFRRHEPYLKKIRGDTGGHFGLNAAQHAVADIPLSYAGKIELVRGRNDHIGPKLYFAGQLALSAMFRHKKGSSDDYHFRFLLRLVRTGYRTQLEQFTIS
jgi:hypothetical protein